MSSTCPVLTHLACELYKARVYRKCARELALADFCSTTGRKELDALLRRVIAARDALDYGGARPPPLVLKIAPDLTAQDLRDVAQVALARRVDGIIISNTTLSRPPHVATSPHGTETGGLSGAPLFEPSTRVLSEIYTLTRGRIPLIGTGGICSGHDAYRKIRAGASLVQVRHQPRLEHILWSE